MSTELWRCLRNWSTVIGANWELSKSSDLWLEGLYWHMLANSGLYWLRLLNYCWEDCIFLVQTYPKSYRNIARVYPRAATGIFYGLFWSKILTKNGNPMWLPEKTCFNLHDMQPVIKFFYLVYQNCASKRAISFAFNSFDQFDLWKPLTTLCNWTVFGKRKNSKK
jgi:hypothetical protein